MEYIWALNIYRKCQKLNRSVLAIGCENRNRAFTLRPNNFLTSDSIANSVSLTGPALVPHALGFETASFHMQVLLSAAQSSDAPYVAANAARSCDDSTHISLCQTCWFGPCGRCADGRVILPFDAFRNQLNDLGVVGTDRDAPTTHVTTSSQEVFDDYSTLALDPFESLSVYYGAC